MKPDASTKFMKGFTLAEMLVTVAVFAIAMSVSSSIFINVNNLQQQTANMAKLQNEGRYMLEKMAKEIRGRELDYGATILSATSSAQALTFKKDEFGDIYNLYLDNSTSSLKIKITNDLGEQNAALNSDEIMVDSLTFRVSPATDPYAITASAASPEDLRQPQIMIMMVIKNRNVADRYRKTLSLQTTISSKFYR